MSTMPKVLIVDDDEDLCDSLKDQLILHDEFDVVTVGTASNGMELAKSDHFDLVVFDVSLPDMDGREAVRLLRKSGFKTPIVMLTSTMRIFSSAENFRLVALRMSRTVCSAPLVPASRFCPIFAP